MIFTETKLRGSYIIEIEKIEDERGFCGRAWEAKEFEKRGLDFKVVQSNISFNKKKGTLRGVHYQASPYEESKLIQCTKVKIFDVIIDLRQGSETFKQWFGIELSSNNYKMLYCPKEFAHGFITLEDNTEVFYHMTEFYNSKHARGVRWNDKAFGTCRNLRRRCSEV